MYFRRIGLHALLGRKDEVEIAKRTDGTVASPAQRQFMRHQTDGDGYYLYADVAGCKCVWRGDKAAYSRYRELARERKVDYKDALYENQDEELLPDIGWE